MIIPENPNTPPRPPLKRAMIPPIMRSITVKSMKINATNVEEVFPKVENDWRTLRN